MSPCFLVGAICYQTMNQSHSFSKLVSSTQRTFRSAHQVTEVNGQHHWPNALSTMWAWWGNISHLRDTWAGHTSSYSRDNPNDHEFHLCGALPVSQREPLLWSVPREWAWPDSGDFSGCGTSWRDCMAPSHAKEFSGKHLCHQLSTGLLFLHFIPTIPGTVDSGPQPLSSPLHSLLPFNVSWPSMQLPQPIGLRQ